MKRVLVVLALIALALPVAAQSYDRKPVRLSGLTPDGWGFSISRGQNKIRADLYPDAYIAVCAGVIMVGHAPDSSWLHGGTRYWDKLYCVVVPTKGATRGVSFVLDAKRTRSIMYRKSSFDA